MEQFHQYLFPDGDCDKALLHPFSRHISNCQFVLNAIVTYTQFYLLAIVYIQHKQRV